MSRLSFDYLASLMPLTPAADPAGASTAAQQVEPFLDHLDRARQASDGYRPANAPQDSPRAPTAPPAPSPEASASGTPPSNASRDDRGDRPSDRPADKPAAAAAPPAEQDGPHDRRPDGDRGEHAAAAPAQSEGPAHAEDKKPAEDPRDKHEGEKTEKAGELAAAAAAASRQVAPPTAVADKGTGDSKPGKKVAEVKSGEGKKDSAASSSKAAAQNKPEDKTEAAAKKAAPDEADARRQADAPGKASDADQKAAEAGAADPLPAEQVAAPADAGADADADAARAKKAAEVQPQVVVAAAEANVAGPAAQQGAASVAPSVKAAGESSDATRGEPASRRRTGAKNGRAAADHDAAATAADGQADGKSDQPAPSAAPAAAAPADPVPVSVEKPTSPPAKPGASGGDSRDGDATAALQDRMHGGGGRTTGRGEQASPGTEQADRVRFVQRVARAFQALGERGGQIRLRLSPPELGTMRLELTVRNGQMTARVETDNPAARSVLLDNLPALRERLAEQQIKVERFEVDVSGQSMGGMPQGPSDQGQGRDPSGRRGPPQRAAPVAARPEPAARRPLRPAAESGRIDVLI